MNSKKRKLGRLFKIILIIFFVLIFSVFLLWKNEITTLLSIKEIMPNNTSNKDGYVYEMTVHGDYYLEDFLKQGGAKSDKELINFITKKITKGLFNLSIEETTIGCSSFYASLENNDKIFARNYDMTKTNVAIVHTKPKGRYKSFSTVDLKFLGVNVEKGLNSLPSKINTLAAAYTPLDGMNEKGVSVGIYMTYQGPGKKDVPTNQNDKNKPDITSTILLRLILDYASNVEEAVEIAKKYNMHDSASSSYHYMVADSSGKSAILEYLGKNDREDIDGSKRELKITYINDANSLTQNDKYQIATNFVVYPNYYQKGDNMNGLDRYKLIKNKLDESNGILKDENSAMDILSIVGRRNWKDDGQLFVTTHSVIYNNTNKTIYWIGNEHYNDEKYTYRMKFE